MFNPESDYALAAGREYYTPPSQVVELRKNLSLIPAVYASEGDIILLLDRGLDFGSLAGYDSVEAKGLTIVDREGLHSLLDGDEVFIAELW